MQGLAFVSSVHESYLLDPCFLCPMIVALEDEPVPEVEAASEMSSP